jgi:hypothetical protein
MLSGASIHGLKAVQAMQPPYLISHPPAVVPKRVCAYGAASLTVDKGDKFIRMHRSIRDPVKTEYQKVTLESQEFHTHKYQKVVPARQLIRKPPHSHMLVIGDA